MCIYGIDGTCTSVTDYDVIIDSEYYNQDYDEVGWEEPIDNEINSQTDVLFE